MRLPHATHATVVAYLALLVALSGTAVAATGGHFVLGHPNSEDVPSSLHNIDKGTGPALRLKTADKHSPNFTVSNTSEIPNLNAALLDGTSASAFARHVTVTLFANNAVQGPDGDWYFLCYPPYQFVGDQRVDGGTSLPLKNVRWTTDAPSGFKNNKNYIGADEGADNLGIAVNVVCLKS